MRYLLPLLLVCSMTSASEPERVVISTDIPCFRSTTLLAELRNKYGEVPIFVGKSELEEDVVTMMLVNQINGSYTVLSVGKGVACILDTGGDVQYRLPKITELM